MVRKGKCGQLLLLVLVVFCCYAAANHIFRSEDGGSSHRSLESLEGTAEMSTSGQSKGGRKLHYTANPHLRVEVPDWSNGLYDPQLSEGEKSNSDHPRRIDFGGPIPPRGAWSAVSFSGYGTGLPRGALFLACFVGPSGRASCDILEDPNRETQVPGPAMYNGWGMYSGGDSGRAFVALTASDPLMGAVPPGSPSDASFMRCCGMPGNTQGCEECSRFHSSFYDPLKTDSGPKEDQQGQAMNQRINPASWPQVREFTPIEPKELFTLLPSLKEQLGATDPENLPCQAAGENKARLPSLGDVLRYRPDLSLFGAMVTNSHVLHLVPCPLTFFAVPDSKVRDFQGHRPPPCLATAFGRPENQRDMLRLVGRQAALGEHPALPLDKKLPLLYGAPGTAATRGDLTLWNNIPLSGEKIPFDRGVIHLLSKNDMDDLQARELLRRIVYWSCLHEHLEQHPQLTRFALLMVDSNRSLPVLGVPPGRRPEWVGSKNPGWFKPPAAAGIAGGRDDLAKTKGAPGGEEMAAEEEGDAAAGEDREAARCSSKAKDDKEKPETPKEENDGESEGESEEKGAEEGDGPKDAEEEAAKGEAARSEANKGEDKDEDTQSERRHAEGDDAGKEEESAAYGMGDGVRRESGPGKGEKEKGEEEDKKERDSEGEGIKVAESDARDARTKEDATEREARDAATKAGDEFDKAQRDAARANQAAEREGTEEAEKAKGEARGTAGKAI